MRLLLVALAVLVSVAHAQVAADLIKSLPNFSGKLGVQYSGYLPINNNKQLHYWFVQSQNDPAKDPVVLWLNGGPGCSSMDGLFYENGPVSFTGDESNTTLVPNPYTWASIANMLYLEAPAGVGFSYAPGQLVYSTDDTTTAADNYEALKQFFTRFPAFKKNEFFISGESYAGVYIPMLAKLVVDGASSFPINLKGTLTGNGVTDDTADSTTNAFVPFVGGHGLVSPQVFDKWMASCSNGQSGDPCDDLNSIFSNAINGLDPYDIYSDCFHQRSSGGPPCVDSTKATTYLNRPDVKAAIHVNSDLSWTICSNIDYNSNADSMVPIYKYLLQHKIRVLVYSGDSDSVVPWTGSQYWTSQMMGFKPKAGRDFTQWYFNDENGSQVGGYVTEYAEGLQFITILASGHMVPQFKPKPALSFFSKFISNTPI